MGDVFKEYSEKKHEELPPLTIIQGGGTILREESDRALQYDKNSLSGYKMVKKNDFIVHLRSFEGGLEKANSDGIISPAYHTFHGDNTDSRFYYPFFRSRRFIDVLLKPHVYGIRDGKSIDIEGMKTIMIPFPSYAEQKKIGEYIETLDNLITLHQCKCIFENYYFVSWEQRKFGDMFERRMERNGGQFDNTRWISVAKMYFQEPDKVTSNNIDTRTYVMRKGDIAFEGHPNAEFKYGRFVENDIGDGVISELFPIYKHIDEYDLNYWKYAIQLESIMQSRLVRCIEISYTSSNKLEEKSFLKESILVPRIEEQKQIGTLFNNLDNLITLHQRSISDLDIIHFHDCFLAKVIVFAFEGFFLNDILNKVKMKKKRGFEQH
ncbi:MAG: restriction endonuclease subunit S [Lachnospiraceae bacterium]|nr:restriction endonuclease subunit S [Lachnospiraceae bacterium]